MGKDEIGRILDEAKKTLDADHAKMSDQIKGELDQIKKKALSGV